MHKRRMAIIDGGRKGLLTGLVCVALSSVPAQAQSLGPFFGIDSEISERGYRPDILPEGFFDSVPRARLGDIAVEANSLTFDADTQKVVAQGAVKLSYDGYLATGDRAEYDRSTGDLVIIGNAVVRDPDQIIYTGDRISVTGDMKHAFVNALQMQLPSGALVTGDVADYENQTLAQIENSTYAPCGVCIDENGNVIGWRVKATKVVLNREEKTLYLEQPTIELLGHSLISLPYYMMPDPTDPRSPGFRFPTVSFGGGYGVGAAVPFFYPLTERTDLWLTPHLLSRQGGLLEGELAHRFDQGVISLHAAVIYQLDRSAFTGQVGDRDLRGAIQTSGTFTPIENWATGWSYQAFTDPNFSNDYDLDGFSAINNAYAQHLSDDLFFDVRVQQFLLEGATITAAQQAAQGVHLPKATLDHYRELPQGFGGIETHADLQVISRGADHTRTVNAVPYVNGYAGTKVHGHVESTWSNPFIVPGGLVLTPYAGLRLDAASYDGGSALLGASSYFSATPTAALDIRYPLLATNGLNSHLFEPILQISYRGNGTSLVGITNDDAQAFVFEDSNLFSFNRFTGSDRQETGLRVNAGGQYLGNFEDGSWLRFVAGQSYHVAGANAFSQVDHANVGTLSGLENPASHFVTGLQAYLGGGLEVAAKAEIDTSLLSLARAGVGAEFDHGDFSLNGDYFYQAPQAALGDLTGTHEIGVGASVPVADYWSINGGLDWDLIANTWSEASAGFGYDDDYLAYGLDYTANQNVSTSAVSHSFGLNITLKGAED